MAGNFVLLPCDLAISGDIFGFSSTSQITSFFINVHSGGQGRGVLVARDGAKHPTEHKTALYNKELLNPKCQ